MRLTFPENLEVDLLSKDQENCNTATRFGERHTRDGSVGYRRAQEASPQTAADKFCSSPRSQHTLDGDKSPGVSSARGLCPAWSHHLQLQGLLAPQLCCGSSVLGHFPSNHQIPKPASHILLGFSPLFSFALKRNKIKLLPPTQNKPLFFLSFTAEEKPK